MSYSTSRSEPDLETTFRDREEQRSPTLEQIEARYERQVYGGGDR